MRLSTTAIIALEQAIDHMASAYCKAGAPGDDAAVVISAPIRFRRSGIVVVPVILKAVVEQVVAEGAKPTPLDRALHAAG